MNERLRRSLQAAAQRQAPASLNVILPGDVIGLPGSFYERAVYAVTAITDLRMNVCSLDAYVQLSYRHPQYALALSWIAVQEAVPPMPSTSSTSAAARRSERLSHFLPELHARLKTVGRAEKARFTLPFSQEVIADVLGLSVPHLNRTMQQLRKEKLIADSDRRDRVSRCRCDANARAFPAAGADADTASGLGFADAVRQRYRNHACAGGGQHRCGDHARDIA